MKVDKIVGKVSSSFLRWHDSVEGGAWCRKTKEERDSYMRRESANIRAFVPPFRKDYELTKDLTESEFQDLVILLKLGR
jgi:hypothetical protein